MKPEMITDAHGGTVEVYDSSAADAPHMWIHVYGGALAMHGAKNDGYAHLNHQQVAQVRDKLNEFLGEHSGEAVGKTTITELVGQAHGHARKSGFHDDAPLFVNTARGREWLSSKLALIHSEVSEALEEVRENDHPLSAYHREDGKPEGFASELADIMVRVADLAGATGIPLEDAITEKLSYNKSRPPKHGKHL